MLMPVSKETTAEFRARVRAAFDAAENTARWIIEASAFTEATRPPVPCDGNGGVSLTASNVDRRLANAFKALDLVSYHSDGEWSLRGEWDHSRSQKLSVRAPPIEAAGRVLQRELGAYGNFKVEEWLN